MITRIILKIYNSQNFNINNLFDEINFYYKDVDKIHHNFDDLEISVEKNKKVFKACKLNDKEKTGLIILNHFDIIFKSLYGNFQEEGKYKEIYNTFIVIMKNHNDSKNLDLYQLNYKSLKHYFTSGLLSSLNNSVTEINELNVNNDEIINNNKKEIDLKDDKNINIIKEEDENKICSMFISDIFNDILDNEEDKNDIKEDDKDDIKEDDKNDNNEISNICTNFVSNVFDDCLNKNKNKNLFEVCRNFVSDVFDDCLNKAKIEKNIKISNDFIEDIFDFCLKRNSVSEINI